MKLTLSLLLVLASLSFRAVAQPDLLNGVAVIVDDSVITYKDVFTSIAADQEFLERRFARQPQVLAQKKKELMEQRIEELVEAKLILREFNTGGFKLPESWIEDQINKDVRNYGNRLVLTKTLQEQGLTYESYRTKIRERIIVDVMFRQNVPPDPVISPHRMELYYQQNLEKYKLGDQAKVRMIVITNRPTETLYSPKRLATDILGKLKEGAPFEEMAKIYSQGSQAAEGGDWGWVEKSVLREDLAAKAFTLKAGEISDLLEAKDGCYLIKVEELRPAHVRPISEVRNEIEGTLKTEENKRLRKKYIERLKKKYFVAYF